MANGYILWEGASLIDGAPIVVIATGFASRSTNRKTGGMVQTYILRRDIDPVSAVQSGELTKRRPFERVKSPFAFKDAFWVNPIDLPER